MQTPTQAQSSAHPPRVGDRYVLRTNLGSGGMGEVWSAYDEVLNRHVAIKGLYLHPEYSAQERENLRIRSLREARAAARIASPTAVAVYDVIEDNQRPWIVMELVNARSLAEVIRADGPLPVESVARIGLAMLEALEAAHAANVVHRDVKPANVLLATDGRIVLTDFGVATVDGDPGMTVTGMVMGSPAYMAPERAQGLEPTPGMDLWGLGATLFAAVEGKGPFSRKDALTTLHAVLTEPLPPLEHAGELAPLLQGLLERDTTARLNAAKARLMLLQIMRGLEGTAADANRVPELDISDMDTATLRTLATLPPSVRNKPPLDMSPSVREPGKAQQLRSSTLLASSSGKHGQSSHSLLAAGVAVLAVIILVATVWYGLTKLGVGSEHTGASTAPTKLPLEAPGSNGTPIALTPNPDPSLVPSATTDDVSTPPPPAAGYQALIERRLGFALDLPQRWVFNPPDPTKPPAPNAISYIDPATARIVQIQRLDADSSLESAITVMRSMQSNPVQVPGYEDKGGDNYTTNDRTIRVEEFTWLPRGGDQQMRVRAVLIVKPGKYAYMVMLSARVEQWRAAQPEFTQMIRSFRVLPQ